MKLEELKKCPNVKCSFIPTKVDFQKHKETKANIYQGGYWIVCSDCGCWTGIHETRQQAIDYWNKRPETDLEELISWWGTTCHTCKQSEMKVAQKLVVKANEIIERRK